MAFRAGERAPFVLTLWMVVLAVPLMAVAGVCVALFGPFLWIAVGVLGGASCFLILWYPARFAAAFHGDYDGHAIRAVKGVLWKKELFIPMTALRTFEFWDTPLQRFFRCRTLVIRFAGGSALLPLMDAGEAAALSEQLERAEDI